MTGSEDRFAGYCNRGGEALPCRCYSDEAAGRSRTWWRRLFRARVKRESECDCDEFSHRLSCPTLRWPTDHASKESQ